MRFWLSLVTNTEPEQLPADDEDVYTPSEEDEVAARLEALGYLG